MKPAYYYLIASLPSLDFSKKPPMTLSEFAQSCQEHLSLADFVLMSKVLASPQSPGSGLRGVLTAYAAFEHQLRNELAFLRAQKLKKDPARYVRGERVFGPDLARAVQEAWDSPDPLSAERALDKARWDFCDELSQGHYFDLEWLLLYALKLKILDRYARCLPRAGEAVVEGYLKECLSF